jgi:hypothetical protein
MWSDVSGFMALQDIDIFAHQSKGITEVALVLILRVHRNFAAARHSNDHSWIATSCTEAV